MAKGTSLPQNDQAQYSQQVKEPIGDREEVHERSESASEKDEADGHDCLESWKVRRGSYQLVVQR
jgi:hypothetical protein